MQTSHILARQAFYREVPSRRLVASSPDLEANLLVKNGRRTCVEHERFEVGSGRRFALSWHLITTVIRRLSHNAKRVSSSQSACPDSTKEACTTDHCHACGAQTIYGLESYKHCTLTFLLYRTGANRKSLDKLRSQIDAQARSMTMGPWSHTHAWFLVVMNFEPDPQLEQANAFCT